MLAFLVAWSLAVGVFPAEVPGLTPATYWSMGVGGVVVLFVSIVVHEFFHSLVARRYHIHMRGITLFIFGGVAEMENEPPNAKSEFLMAAAGPASSLAISALGYAVLAVAGGLAAAPRGVLWYLAYINLILALFNCVPAFPLDGGRMLRSALWHFRGDLRSATRTAAWFGRGFGLLLIALGVLAVINAEIVGGIWFILIGMFVRNAAAASYQQVLLRQALEGEPVRRFMHTDPIRVPGGITVQQLVDDFVYRHHHKLYPVIDDARLAGCVTIEQVKAVPRAEWAARTVTELATSCSPDVTIGPDADALAALAKMRRGGKSRLLVVEGDRLLGILTLRDLLDFFALKVDLEG